MATALPEDELPEIEFACLKRHDLICKGCREVYRNPMTLPCLHVLCSKCVDKGMIEEKGDNGQVIRKVKCEYCKTVSAVEKRLDVKMAYYQTTVVEINWVLSQDLTKQRCQGLCSSDNGPDVGGSTAEKKPVRDRVTVYCLDCSRFLCDKCVDSHDGDCKSSLRLDVELDYEAVRVACTKRQARCEYHPRRIGPFFCVDCSVAICEECRAEKHATHEHDRLDVLAEKSLAQYTKFNETVNACIKQVKDAMKETQRQKEKADRDMAMMKQMVRENTEKMLQQIREQEAAIMAQLDLKEQALDFRFQDRSGRKP